MTGLKPLIQVKSAEYRLFNEIANNLYNSVSLTFSFTFEI